MRRRRARRGYVARVSAGDRTGGRSDGPTDATAAARGTAALAVSQVATRALGLGFVLVATRVLEPAVFGRYAVVSALLLGAATIADLGTTSVVTTLVSREPASSSPILASIVLPSFILGVLSLGALLSFVVLARYPAVTRSDALVVGIGLPADAVLTSLLGGFDGRGLLSRRALLSTVRTAITIGGGLIGMLITSDVEFALVALAAGPTVTLAITVVSARRQEVWDGRIRHDLSRLRVVLRQAVPLALLGGINVIVLRADVVILSLLAPRSEVARYDVALRATEALSFLGTVVAAPSLFILSRRLGARDTAGAQRAFDEATRLGYLLGLPLSAMLITVGGPLGVAVFGDPYRAVGRLLAILGLQLWLAIVAAIQGSLLLAGGHLRRAVRRFAALAAIAVGVEVAAIAWAGATGAALAMVAVQSLIVVTAAEFSRRQSGVSLRRPPLGAVGAALASAAIMALSGVLWLPVRLLAGAVVYVAVLSLTRTVGPGDIQKLVGPLRRDPAASSPDPSDHAPDRPPEDA